MLVPACAGVTIDLGTGDGRAALAAARDEPHRLVLGVDADPTSMRDAARRAARGRIANAAFVVAAAEAMPVDLEGVVDRITLSFPWGSLLRGLVEAHGPVLSGIRRISAAQASIRVVWSVTARDGIPSLRDPAAVGEAFGRAGFEVRQIRAATRAEIEATHSSWAKRLGAGRERSANLLVATLAGPPRSDSGRRAS